MSMRRHLRFRAHANMKALGLAHVNRKYRIGKENGRSFFARAWRAYVNPEKVRAKKKRQADGPA